MKPIVVSLLAVVLSAAVLPAQTQYKCTLADVKGAFAVQPIGILTSGPFAGPFSATGVINFDGAGGFTGVATSNFNGHVIYPFGAIGFYTVTPDCLVTTLELTLHISFRGYLSATKNEILFQAPDASSITLNLSKRILKPTCATADLTGNWAIGASGSDARTGSRIAQNGRFAFDGHGNLTGVSYTSTEGIQTSDSATGSYSVNPDCTFEGRQQDTTGNISHFFGVIFNDAEFIFVYSDDGQVLPGQGRKAID